MKNRTKGTELDWDEGDYVEVGKRIFKVLFKYDEVDSYCLITPDGKKEYLFKIADSLNRQF